MLRAEPIQLPLFDTSDHKWLVCKITGTSGRMFDDYVIFHEDIFKNIHGKSKYLDDGLTCRYEVLSVEERKEECKYSIYSFMEEALRGE